MGKFLDDLFGTKENSNDEKRDGKLELRQEELDVTKNKVKTGEVTLSKEVVEEEKHVDVPVMHEEVVIERKALNHEPSDAPISSGETIHIPVSEEKVDVEKHTVVTGEVSAHKREIEDTKTINETLKKEEARIDKDGSATLASEDAQTDEETRGFY
ncbi:YsnF/AvaK domain-containing protein [Clostridium sp. 'White wine YQ']|uniref:YsnF/AvaK domain-containing protein n=1 Tax=Clostridium sp. 'White wine YQ' TaxID=3027474 RepID=UPI002365653C|nr:YsnF/AvaK domain-containing protein [Clostridium sp. 'White wine YQ']MDD7793606.1 YsnF/AvaK domain-containing protein [Clostridium sp. 'White wine YQ']